ncbi:MAG TPA: SAM-dependent chlorinase/fluorinase [Phycisphaerae bacterium]|nr:SAM-dependent chlorinase/fluorinase [Phycisphaerae bacterium]
MPLITLLTDFGTRDQYVASLKGVILHIAPSATVVDVTHKIPPRDVIRAALMLRQIWPWYPPGTIHVAVVDPGVGSRRRILAGRYDGRFVVAPDNGLVSMLHRELRVEAMHVVENPRYMLGKVSPTFHGRDIMAPVAAHLASGVPIEKLGPPTDHLEILKFATPERMPDYSIVGEVLYADQFGNLVTNIARNHLLQTYQHRSGVEVYLDGVRIGPIRTSYHEVDSGKPLALIGSDNHLEIAVNCGHAGQTLSANRGSKVEVR